MKRSTRLPQLIALLATALAFAIPAPIAHAASGFPDKPNIILVMTDDQGYGDIAAHGNSLIQTPHLDRMHAESVRLTDFQVSPTCAPTRASIMTGRHEFKSGVTHTIHERERLSLKAVTLAQVLQSAGYTTGIFGKWHLGDEAPHQPDRRGFDEVYIHGAGGIGQTYAGSCGDAPDNKYFDPAILHNGTFVKTKGYCTDLFFDQAIRWLEARPSGAKPFFVYITPNAPHGPLISPGPNYDKLYEGKSAHGNPLTKGDIAYYSMISNIDDNMGKLLAKVKDLGLEKNTLVIFMTDNGGTHTKLFNAGMRGSKGGPYQGGTRVPAFWRWPGVLPAGVDVPALTAHIDLYPTFAELTGTAIPPDARLDGRSLVPLLKDATAPWPDRYVFVHVGRWQQGQAAQSQYANSAVRSSRYRLVNNKELYDLQSDPGETTNVIDEHPDVVAALRKAQDQWWREALAGMDNEDVIPPKINPFKALYWKQYGGGPDAALLKRMDPGSL